MNKIPTQILYILQMKNSKYFKIGITDNLNRRLAQLQTGCPEELIVIKLYTHYQRKIIEKYERVLHNYYKKCGCKVRSNGEWFYLSQADIKYLCKPNTIEEQNKLIEDIKKMM